MFYAIGTNGVWGTPALVHEDDTADFSFDAAVDGDDIYVIWQNATHTFANDATLDDMLAATDVYTTEFSGSGFTGAQNLCAPGNTRHEMNLTLSVDNGKLAATWVENNENNVWGGSTTNKIVRRVYDGTWRQSETLQSGLGDVISVDTAWIDGTHNAAYVLNLDSAEGNAEGLDVFTVIGSTVNRLTDNAVADYNAQYAQIGDETSLFWVSDNEIVTTQGGTGVVYGSGASNLQVTGNADGNAVMFWRQAEDFTSELAGSYYDKDDGVWGNPLSLSEFGGHVSAGGGYLSSDGLRAAAVVAEVLGTPVDDSPYGRYDLVVSGISKTCDLAMEGDPTYSDENDIVPSNTVTFYATAVNKGAKDIGEIKISLLDGSQAELASTTHTLPEPLKTGESIDLEVEYTLPGSISKTDLTAKLEVVGETDVEPSNNTGTVTYGLPDVSVEDVSYKREGGTTKVTAIIKNQGYSAAGNIGLALLEENAEGNEVATQTIATLAARSDTTVEFTVPDALLQFTSESDLKNFYLKAEIDEAEGRYGNNGDLAVIYPIAVDGINALQATLSLKEGEEGTLTTAVTPANAFNQGICWMSGDENVATVDADGKVTAAGVGDTVITAAAAQGDFTTSCAVSVVPADDFTDGLLIKSYPDKLTYAIGDTLDLTGGALYYAASGTVSSVPMTDGMITGFDSSTAGICLLPGTHADHTTEFAVQILTAEEASESEQDKADKIAAAYTQSQISEIGTVVFTDACKEKIDAAREWYEALTDAQKLLVTNYDILEAAEAEYNRLAGIVSATGVTLNKANVSINIGDTVQLTATVLPSNATNKGVNWSSNNSSVASVTSTGLVQGVGAGTAVIKATTSDGGFPATCTVTVAAPSPQQPVGPAPGNPAQAPEAPPSTETSAAPVTSVRFPQTSLTLIEKKGINLAATTYTEDGSKATLAYTSSKPAIAKVSTSGKITAVKAGTAKITATAENGKKATITVKVVKSGTQATKVNKVSASVPKSMKVGQIRFITGKYSPSNAAGAKVTYASNKKAILAVDKWGQLVAKKKGTAVITVKAGGKSQKYTVIVK